MISLLAFAMMLTADTTGGATPAIATGVPPQSIARTESSAPVPRDTLVRVPGSVLRLGWSPERTSTLGSFRLVNSGEDSVTREGEIRWFGSPARATLTYREDHLAELRIVASHATRKLGTYVADELRRQGYRRVSEEVSSSGSVGQWQGRSHLRLTIGSSSVVAEISPRPASPAPAPAALEPERLDFTPGGPDDSLPPPRRAFTPADPVRPPAAVEAGVFGRVTVRAEVDTSGVVTHAAIVRGIRELSDAAIDWAGGVRFEPCVRSGRPVRFSVLIPVAFLPARSAGAGGKP